MSSAVKHDGLMKRRDFLKVSATAAGGVSLGLHIPAFANALGETAEGVSAGIELNAWLIIEPDNSILFRIAQAEMGQGVMTSMAMLLAEELEADWRTVRVEYADVNRQIRSGGEYGRMKTGDSLAVRHSRPYLQLAGAEARERMIKAAAERWVVSPADCYADYGKIYRRGSGDTLTFGDIAGDAAKVNVAGVKIKGPEAFNVIGLPTRSIDAKEKVDGSALFSMDVRRPNMVYAAVLHCPVLGGRVRSLRFNAIRHMPGVLKSVRMENSVAVVAKTFWQAKLAADELPVFWEEGPGAKAFSDTVKRDFFNEFSSPGEILAKSGDIVGLMDAAENTIESDYFMPYLAHAALEPMNCTVEVGENRIDVWVGHQDPEYAARVVAEVAKVDIASVYIHNCYLGGSFGRRAHRDFVEQATLIALEMGQPVQMIWTREEDMKAGAYRPMSAMRFKAGFDIDKNLKAFTTHSVTHSVRDDNPDHPDSGKEGVEAASVEGLIDHPYNFPAFEISHTAKNTHVTSWCFRSGGHSLNALGVECFLDEMALAAEQNPLQYRRELLGDQPRYQNVLDVLEQASGWGKTRLPRGSAMGLALHKSYDTVCGIVSEATVTPSGGVTVNRIVAVVDCGNVVNPTGAEKQVESGILFGLSAALFGKLTIENGKVLEDNLDTYEVIRMPEMPKIEIHWALSGGDIWGGLGEATTPPVAPSICNALYEITKRRIRSLPVKDYYLRSV
jgi:isoquinoline 1-oxidoreductase beta subunit